MDSCMVHLNCFPPRAASVNFWFLIAVQFGGGCWYKANANCEMLLRKIGGEINVHNLGFCAKWRLWRHASRLTATAVITASRHHFSKRWHIADVKNITDDDQANLMVHQNSTNMAYTFRFYVCVRLRNRDCCSVADGNGSCHSPTPSYFEEITRCRHKKTSLEKTRQP